MYTYIACLGNHIFKPCDQFRRLVQLFDNYTLFYLICRLVALSIVFGLSYHDFPECNEGKLAKIYFYLNIALMSIQFLLQIIILVISTRGTVMDPDKRSSITKFIYLWLIALLPEIVLTAAGSVWVFHPGPECEKDIVWSIRALIIFQWLVLLLLVILTIVLFNPLGKRNSHGQNLYNRSSSFQQVECARNTTSKYKFCCVRKFLSY